jgi:hypothetical protein
MKFIPEFKALFLVSTLVSFLLVSCGDDIPSSANQSQAYVITELIVTPTQIAFNPSDGVKDSVISINVSGRIFANLQNPQPSELNIELIRASDSQPVAFRNVTIDATTTFEQNITIPSNTTDFNDYRLYLYVSTGDQISSNSAQATVKVRGFALGVPEILATSNPDTVRIPTSGTTPFALQAKVTHPDGQALVDRVFVDIRDQQNNLLAGSPFRLFDDGNVGSSNSGDAVAADSIFTRVFNIGSSNNPDIYQLFYYALDTQGANSDTVQTQMVIQR